MIRNVRSVNEYTVQHGTLRREDAPGVCEGHAWRVCNTRYGIDSPWQPLHAYPPRIGWQLSSSDAEFYHLCVMSDAQFEQWCAQFDMRHDEDER